MKQIIITFLFAVAALGAVDAKSLQDTTAVSVTSVDTTEVADSILAHNNAAQFSMGFQSFQDTMEEEGEMPVEIVAVVGAFAMPLLIVLLVCYFRYKSQKTRYRLAEQALANGHPVPEGLFGRKAAEDQRAKGIKNTFMGIGLFIFLWAITGRFAIGSIGLLVMFMGIGQWLVAYQKGGEPSDKDSSKEE